MFVLENKTKIQIIFLQCAILMNSSWNNLDSYGEVLKSKWMKSPRLALKKGNGPCVKNITKSMNSLGPLRNHLLLFLARKHKTLISILASVINPLGSILMKRVSSGSMLSCSAGVICSPAAGIDTLTWILFCSVSVQCTFAHPEPQSSHLSPARYWPFTAST